MLPGWRARWTSRRWCAPLRALQSPSMTLSWSARLRSCFSQSSRVISLRLPGGAPRVKPERRTSGGRCGGRAAGELAAVERAPDGEGDAGPADDVPEAVRQPVGDVHPLRAVVVQVMPLDVAEVPSTEAVEVHGVVHPLLDDVRLHEPGQEGAQGLDGQEEAHEGQGPEEGEGVRHRAVDVIPVPGPLVVLPVQVVEVRVEEVLEEAGSVREPPMEDVPVDPVLDGGPEADAQRVERHRQRGPPAEGEADDRDGRERVDDGEGVQAMASVAGLHTNPYAAGLRNGCGHRWPRRDRRAPVALWYKGRECPK